MKTVLPLVPTLLALPLCAAAVEIRTTTFERPWQACRPVAADAATDAVLTVDAAKTDQTMVGFGTAVSELSWDSLSLLSAADRAKVLDEICSPEGGAFTVFRTPIGSSDFAREFGDRP